MGGHAVIIGSTAQIGLATVDTLAARGWSVTAVHRGPTPAPATWQDRGIRDLRADRNQPGELLRVLSGGADVVVDVVAYDGSHARQLLAAAQDVGSAVVISSASVYADTGGRILDTATGADDFPHFTEPMREEQPTAAPGPESYSTRKVELERELLDDGSLPVTIVRACAVHGVGSSTPREMWPLLRAIDRRQRIPLAYRGDSVFHTISAPNLAELIVLAAEQPGSRIINAGDPDPLDVSAIVGTVCAIAGHQPELVRLDSPPGPGGAGQTPWSVPLPFVVDMSAAARELGYRPVTSYTDAVEVTCEWLRGRLDGRPWREAFPRLAELYGDLMDNYAAEDAALS